MNTSPGKVIGHRPEGNACVPVHVAGAGSRRRSLICAAIGMAVASTVAAQEEASSRLEEIVVSATRRDQAVLEIPYNISAIRGEDLKRLGVTDFTAIASHVPGLVATQAGARNDGVNSSFIIRGVNASTVGAGAFQNLISPSVSTYVDEMPMFANLRLNDIARVEVLRGPQGTLYGAGSVGGTIRLIHNAPSTEATEFRLSAEGGTLEESDDLDYRADLVGNLPVNDRVAVRVSAGYENLAGFIDATDSVVVDGNRVPILADPTDPVGSPFITEEIDDVDSSETWFVRTSALFDVTEDVRLQLTYHHQDESADGFSAQQLDGEGYTMGRRIADEPSDRTLDLFAATVTADLGFATLTSATGYFEQEEESIRDISLFPIIFAQYYGYYPRITMPGFDEFSTESFTQELRLVSQGDGPWHWTVGGYYQDLEVLTYEEEKLKGIADWSELPGTGFGPFPTFGDVTEYFGLLRPSQIQPEDLTYLLDRTVEFEDKALFGELTYDLTEAWSVTVGMRAFWQETSQDLLVEIPYFGPIVAEDGNIYGRNEDYSDASFNDQIFKFNTSYQVSDETLLYATVSEGFRAGGGNAYPVGNCPYCDPPDFISFDPDTATNYEIGIKGTLADVLQYSAAVFRIDWEDIQLETSSTSTSAIIVNAGKAQSQGAELELTWAPADGLMLTGGYSYVDAELSEDVFLPVGGQLAPGGGYEGDPLPGVSDHQFSGAVDYRWPLEGARALLLHLDASYRSEFPFRLSQEAANYRVFDGFWMVNASIGIELSEKLQVLAYGRNLGNEEGVTAYARPTFSGNTGTPPPEYSYEFLQRPRTLGLRVDWQF